ncbi:MAG TPA: sigma 54-interacting transcriptional regulator [Kofleriaceae bacterium]|nr:sigma 54-interacting transcriptional regulator [Kofleriaceae bacterium]
MTTQREATETQRGHVLYIRQFEVTVVDGPDKGARAVSSGEELTIGATAGNDLVLTDGAASRHHCALRTASRGLELRDLNSTNGTFVGDCEISRAYVRSGARIRVGQTTLAVRVLDHELEQPLADSDRIGELLGTSPAMRKLFPLLERCAQSTATVLIEGETGTGKELVAEAIHEASDRKAAPFVVIDCSALSHDLAESELFGHVRGAFTGADHARTGAFEQANGGTIFLDEIGELPLALQPLLLRVLESRTVRRIGTNQHKAIDVRVIAASHRDLRALVNQKRFRTDLFYRLNVVKVNVPPLRERAGDIELLAAYFWSELRPEVAIPPGLVAQLAGQSWPGNVRELRNAVERAAVIGWQRDETAEPLTYQDAKDRWERTWIEGLVRAHGGNLSRAARAARMGRSHLRELLRRYQITATE